jgi:major capsid protein gp7
MKYGLSLLALVFAIVGVDVATVSLIGHHLWGLSQYVALHTSLDHTPVMMGVAALGTGALTLADWAKRSDPDGMIARIVELLNQTNDVLQDMRWIEGNLPTGHQTTVRTALPTVAFRRINNGVTPSKSTTAQILESTGILEAWAEVDCEVAKLNGDINSFRLSEALPFIESMNQTMSTKIFYGNQGTTPEEFNGLATRYNDTTLGNGTNIIKADGSGSDNSSIFLVVWGENTVHGIIPKGSTAGLQHEDLGEQTITVSTGIGGDRMRAYQDRFVWKAGLAVKDWRYVVRICNIDISNLIADSSPFSADLIKLMIKAVYRIPTLGMGTPVFYTNRTIAEWLAIQAREAVSTGGQLSYDVVEGKPITRVMGIPVRRVDALTQAEATVS